MENKEEIGKACFGSVVKAKYVPKNRTVVGKTFFGEGKAVNKTRIGSDCGSDRTADRIGSDWYFRFWYRRSILRKAVFNNDTGGSE